jgi:low temperature requirement protein LtrA
VWAANAQAEHERTVTVTLLVATPFIFIAGLALPQVFRPTSVLLFAVAYAVVRFLHLALYADASRKGNAQWSAIAGFAITVTIGMALLVGGAVAHGSVRIVLWAVAVAVLIAIGVLGSGLHGLAVAAAATAVLAALSAAQAVGS